MPWYAELLIVLAVFIVPIMLGYYLSRMWRMPDYMGKIALVLFTTLAGLVICVAGWPPRLGIDLRGGAILVYDIPESGMEKVKGAAGAQQAAAGQQPLEMGKLIGAIGNRINPGGVREITIRPYGARQIEIIVPQADPAQIQDLESRLSSIGTLEFRILATTHRPQYRSYIERAKTLPSNQDELLDEDGNVLAKWVPVAKGKESEFAGRPDIGKRTVKLRSRETGKLENTLEVLVVEDQFNVTGAYLTQARPGEQMGQPVVEFFFNNAGAQLFGRLTGSHLPDKVQNFKYNLGVILDGQLRTAPQINSTIYGSGIIEGYSDPKEVQKVVDVLNAGSLPTALSPKPVSENFTGPTLGSDTIRMGKNAAILSMVVVCLFMIVYYRFSGIVASLALAVNLVLLLACMIAIKAAFSLPGIAGFALTIGMAVDSNVLIYERIREEMDRGAGLRMAIRNGFDRAFSAIFDSHLTTLISAAVLYAVGQEQIKGFAITLFLGVAINLYTAVFAVHVVFDVAERQKLIKNLKMMRFLTKPNIDFWGLRYRCYTASIVLTMIGLIGVFVRGQGFLNIDFTGGVSVQAVFDKPQQIAHVRETLAKLKRPDGREALPDLVVSDVKKEGEEVGRRFMINTSSPPGVDATDYLKTVQDEIRKAFPGQLAVNSVTVSDVRPVAEPPGKPPAGSKKQTRADLPAHTLVASTDPSSVLLALGEPAAKAQTAKPQAEKPTAKSAAAEKPAAAKPTAAKPAAGKAAEKGGAKPAPAPLPAASPPRTPASPATAPASPPATGSSSATAGARAGGPFAGGTEATLHFHEALRYDAMDQLIRTELDKLGAAGRTVDFEISNPNYSEGDTNAYKSWTVKIDLPKPKAQSLFHSLAERLRNSPYFPSSNTIGGSVAAGTRVHAVYAVIVSCLLIMLYLWVRFQRLSYGVAAVVALIHDVLVALGFLAMSFYIAPLFNAIGLRFLMLEPFKIGMTEVAAFLTIVGYSVSDTVVVFDRIREVRGKAPNVTPEIINTSINQTMSRTILTSLTAWLVVVVLYFLGGPTIHGFAFAMIIGILTGTYSSIYVAAPLLLVGRKHVAVKAEYERNNKRGAETRVRRLEPEPRHRP